MNITFENIRELAEIKNSYIFLSTTQAWIICSLCDEIARLNGWDIDKELDEINK